MTGQHAYSNTIRKEEENNIERIFEKNGDKSIEKLAEKNVLQ